MFEALEQYLLAILPQERVRLMMETFSIIRTHRGDSIENILSNFLSNVENTDTLGNVETLNDLLFSLSDETLRCYGLFLKPLEDDYKLSTLYHILQGLAGFESYEDPATLRGIIENSEDGLTAFCECIATVTDTLPEDYLDYIQRINENFIQNLYQVLEEREKQLQVDKDEEIEDVDLNKVALLKRFTASPYFKNVNPVLVRTLAPNAFKLSLIAILRVFGNRLGDNPNGAWDWLFVLIISSEDRLETLFDLWGRCFLEETQLIDMKQKVERAYRLVVQLEG